MLKKLLMMKFHAFVIMIVAFMAFLCIVYTKWSVDWQLGFEAQETSLTRETVEEAILREVEQLETGWTGPPSHPNIPVMLWWTPFTGDDGVQKCGEHQCYFTNERRFRHHPMLRTVFFYGTDFKPYDVPIPRKSGEDWAVFHEESPKNNPTFSHQTLMGNFNHTATFRRTSDFPLTTQYLEGLNTITEPSFLVPLNVKNRMVSEGLAPVAYVQSGCDTPLGRDEWVKEFMKFVKVDSYGTCLHNKDLPEEIKGSEKMDNREYLSLLAKYKFIIAIENAVCEDYVTEKLWKPLQVGAVPIYLGAPNVEDYLPSKQSAILVKNYSSVEEVAQHVLYLDREDSEYKKHLSHKAAHNGDQGGLVENVLLKEMIKQRRWGVSSRQQAEMGNFVKHFQCFVCERVANNVKFTNMGFRPLPYNAGEHHYGCKAPTSPLTGKVEPNNWWTQSWSRSEREAKVADSFYKINNPFNSSQFYTQMSSHRPS